MLKGSFTLGLARVLALRFKLASLGQRSFGSLGATHRLPSHSSKTVLSTVHDGGPECTVLRTFRWEVLL